MIIEFDHKKSTVTFGGGRFICFFVKRGLVSKTLEISVFEADQNFQPLNSKSPLFMESVAFDERKILSALKIIGGIDSGEATWIPNGYLSKDRSSRDIQDLEEKSAQMAFGKADILLNSQNYEAALLNITASLLSKYLRGHPEYESRFLRKQAEAYVGLDNYFEAKKALLKAMEKYELDSDFKDYFTLGCIDYKLGNRKEAINNLRKFIELANLFIKSSNDDSAREENKKTIEISNQLINKFSR